MTVAGKTERATLRRMAPDTPISPAIDYEEAERLLLEAAVAEARAEEGRGIPHEEVREEMLAMIAEAQERIATLLRQADGRRNTET